MPERFPGNTVDCLEGLRVIAEEDEDTLVREIKSVGICGPGAMGTGIAMCFINAGLPVVLVGLDEPTKSAVV